MGESRELVLVEKLISKAAVERFDISVLVRLTGLDLLELDAIAVSPVQHRLAKEFWTVVGSNDLRQTTGERQFIEYVGDLRAAYRSTRHECHALVRGIFDEAQAFDGATIGNPINTKSIDQTSFA